MPTAPSAFPLLGAPQAPGDEPNLPEGSKSLGGRPPEAEGNYPAAKTHPARSAPQPARPAEVLLNNWRSAVLLQPPLLLRLHRRELSWYMSIYRGHPNNFQGIYHFPQLKKLKRKNDNTVRWEGEWLNECSMFMKMTYNQIQCKTISMSFLQKGCQSNRPRSPKNPFKLRKQFEFFIE